MTGHVLQLKILESVSERNSSLGRLYYLATDVESMGAIDERELRFIEADPDFTALDIGEAIAPPFEFEGDPAGIWLAHPTLGECSRITLLPAVERLEFLEVLILQGCSKLRNLTGLEKLLRLRRLSITDCAVDTSAAREHLASHGWDARRLDGLFD